jgi:hypothetical protein
MPRVVEYDGAFKCLDCGGVWGAITNPTGHLPGCPLPKEVLEKRSIIQEVAAAFVEGTDYREFPNWDDAGKPAPFFVAIANKLYEARRERDAELDNYKRAAELLDKAYERIAALEKALRDIMELEDRGGSWALASEALEAKP